MHSNVMTQVMDSQGHAATASSLRWTLLNSLFETLVDGPIQNISQIGRLTVFAVLKVRRHGTYKRNDQDAGLVQIDGPFSPSWWIDAILLLPKKAPVSIITSAMEPGHGTAYECKGKSKVPWEFR